MSEEVGARRKWTKEDDDTRHRGEKEKVYVRQTKKFSPEEARNKKTM